MDKEKNAKAAAKHRKTIRKEHRMTIRFTEPLFEELENRAYKDNKTVSSVIIEAIIKHLDFKMPPRD